jgi:hypothetical protein
MSSTPMSDSSKALPGELDAAARVYLPAGNTAGAKPMEMIFVAGSRT